jgi:hypothetical protein
MVIITILLSAFSNAVTASDSWLTFPIKIHLICKRQASGQQESHYLVITTFFKMGQENKLVNGFIDRIPAHENDTLSLAENPVFIEDLVEDVNLSRKH